MSRLPRGVTPHWTAASLCAGLAAANAIRFRGPLLPLLCVGALALAASSLTPGHRLALVCLAAASGGLAAAS